MAKRKISKESKISRELLESHYEQTGEIMDTKSLIDATTSATGRKSLDSKTRQRIYQVRFNFSKTLAKGGKVGRKARNSEETQSKAATLRQWYDEYVAQHNQPPTIAYLSELWEHKYGIKPNTGSITGPLSISGRSLNDVGKTRATKAARKARKATKAVRKVRNNCSPGSANGLDVNHLIELRNIANQVGGTENLRQLVGTLEELQV